jgi:hypothetical protein
MPCAGAVVGGAAARPGAHGTADGQEQQGECETGQEDAGQGTPRRESVHGAWIGETPGALEGRVRSRTQGCRRPGRKGVVERSPRASSTPETGVLCQVTQGRCGNYHSAFCFHPRSESEKVALCRGLFRYD